MTTSIAELAPTSAPPRHLLTLDGLGPGGLASLLDLTRRLKRDPEGDAVAVLQGERAPRS
jgi:hypothetical protein